MVTSRGSIEVERVFPLKSVLRKTEPSTEFSACMIPALSVTKKSESKYHYEYKQYSDSQESLQHTDLGNNHRGCQNSTPGLCQVGRGLHGPCHMEFHQQRTHMSFPADATWLLPDFLELNENEHTQMILIMIRTLWNNKEAQFKQCLFTNPSPQKVLEGKPQSSKVNYYPEKAGNK